MKHEVTYSFLCNLKNIIPFKSRFLPIVELKLTLKFNVKVKFELKFNIRLLDVAPVSSLERL